jgi:O-antigen/teichoic acid export membrane protein
VGDKQGGMVSDTKVYMFAEILRNSVSLIMLPIYTRFLTTEDYGSVELLSMIIDFATIIFGARATQAVFRFYCTSNSAKEKKEIIASALFLSFFMGCIGAVFVIALSEPLALAIFGDAAYQKYIILFALTMTLLPLIDIPLVYIRAMQKPGLFFNFSIVKLFIQVSLNIYFVVYREMHVEGVVYSTLFSFAIVGTILTSYTVFTVGLDVTKKACTQLFIFSLPMKLATVGAFFLTFGDRYILNIYTDLSQVGIYSLGYKFAFIYTILSWDTFEKMWDAEKYAVYEKPDAKITYQKVFLYINIVLFTVGLGFSLFVKDLLRIMSAPAFWPAHEVVPIIIMAYIIQSWGRYCNFGIMLKEKTIQIAYAQWFAVLVVTIAYFTLIPAFGISGAAWATVIGFTAQFYWINKKGKEYYNMYLPWMKVFLIAVLAIACFMLTFIFPEDLLLSISLRVVIFVLFCSSLFLLPILHNEQKEEIKLNIKNFIMLSR